MKIRRIKHSGSKRGYFIGFFLPVFIISMLLHLPVHINAADIPRTVSEVADFVLDDRAVISDMGKSWYQGYEPAVYPDTYSDWMILYVPVRSEKAVGQITASFFLMDPDVYLLNSAPAEVKTDAVNGLYGIKLTLNLKKNRVNGDFPAMIRICGQDSEGNELITEFQYVIRVRNGKDNPEKYRPELSLSGDLTVGEEGILTLSLLNPATTVSLTDAIVELKEDDNSVTVNGKNIIELPEIFPGQELKVPIPVLVNGNASVTPHRFTIRLCYTAVDQEETREESFILPISQEICLEQGGIEMPPTAVEGELASFDLSLMNLGKSEIMNAMVSLELDCLTSKQSVLVGTIYPGETKQARISFSPLTGVSGLQKGTVSVYCEDAYGNTKEEQYPVELTVEKRPVKVPEEEVQEKKTFPDWTIPVLGGGCSLFLLGFIVQGAVLRRKLHKLEEDRL